MAFPVGNGLDLQLTDLLNALIHGVASDPASPKDRQLWYNTTTERLMIHTGGDAPAGTTQQVAYVSDVTAGAITAALWDAQSVIKAVVNDTPVVQVFAEGEMLGRPTGGDLGAMTPAAVRAELSVYTQAQTDTEITNAITNLVGGAPLALDTLNELAAAVNDDASFASSVTTSLDSKGTKYVELIGDGATTALAITHNLATTDVIVQLYEVASNQQILADIVITSANVVTATFAVAPTTDAIRAVVVG